MQFYKKSKVLFALSAIALILGANFVLAQTPSSPEPTQSQLQQQLLDIQNQIDDFQRQLDQIKGEKNTLQNKINQLKKQQASLTLKIQATSLQITDLDGQISVTQNGITASEQKALLLQQQIGNTLRVINERDSRPLLYALVEQGNLSDLLDDIQNTVSVSNSLKNLLEQARQTKSALEKQKQDLGQKQDDAKDFLSVQTLQRQKLTDTVGEQNTLLEQTKGRESDYQITINDTRRRANEIRNRIYDLLGISKQITFDDALKIAQWVSQINGIEPAFLLAVLTQESNLGKNVGTCNRPGDGPEKSWKVVMKPDRDQKPFLEITSDLGLDPEITPVSCPMKDKKGKQVGWGGAMGPAQFIPSTWMGYKDQVKAITGKAANPWDIRDAFLAAGIKLKAGGADNTAKGQWNAAMRYFSGGTNTKYRFYGDNVAALTEQYRTDISTLNQ